MVRPTATHKKIPVTILTGFLGSGKTTLLNHLLIEQHGKKFAIIENEFGEVGVDDALIRERKYNADEDIVVMNNGCICCTVRGDLIRMIHEILKKDRALDGILIETTGLADPAPVAQTFFVDETVAQCCTLDGIITVVDAEHILQHLLEIKPEGVENESVEQIAFADRVLLNKTDLVTPQELECVKREIRKINETVEIVECQHCRVDPTLLLNIQSFDLDKILVQEPDFLENTDHQHDVAVFSVGFTIPEPVNLGKLQDWIQDLLTTKGTDLLRYKGVINVMGMDQRFVFQGVHMLFDGSFTSAWGNDPRVSRFVFIGKNLDRDALTQGFADCKAGPLRFRIGDRVEARVRGGYQPGEIVQLWDQGNPYRIRLDGPAGVDVWGPLDDDMLVRSG